MSGATNQSTAIAARTITVTGLRLATAINTVARGALGRPALVVLPAAGFLYQDYLPILERFAPERRVAALDWPGFGGSTRPSPVDFTYSAPAFAALLGPWLTVVGATRAVLLGNGIGGAAALHFALAQPERVAGLVLVSPWGFAIRNPARSLLLRALSLPWLLARVEPLLTSLALGPANPATRTILAARRRARRASDHPASVAALAALARADRLPNTDLAATLAAKPGALDVPSIVVRGALDPVASAADARHATDLLGSSGRRRTLEVVLPNAGHLPWLQQPAPFLDAVRGLLETVESG